MTANEMIFICVHRSFKKPENVRVHCYGTDKLRIMFKKSDERNNNGVIFYDVTLARLAKYIAKHNLGNYVVYYIDSRGGYWPLIDRETLTVLADEVIMG